MPRIPRGLARFPAPAMGQPRLWGPLPRAGADGTRGPRAGMAPCPLAVAGCHCGPVVHPVPDMGMGVAAHRFALPRPQGAGSQCSGCTWVPRPPWGNACPRGVPTLMGYPSQWDTCPGGMPFPGMPILGLCPPLWDVYPGGKPTPGGYPCQWGTCQPRSCTPPLPQPFSGCSQTPRTGAGPHVGPVAGPGPPGPGRSNLSALPGPPPPPEPRGAVSPGRER